MMLKRVASRVLVQLKNQYHSGNVTKIGIIGVPFDKGQPKLGVANGPKVIREAGLVEHLSGIRKSRT